MRWTPLFLGLALLAGCDSAPEQPTAEPVEGMDAKAGITVSDARLVLPVVDGRPGAIYLTLANTSDKDAELAAIYLDGADRVELHESKMDNGVMTMETVDGIAIPAGQTVALEQGGLHAMVFGIDPADGSATREITLTFADGDKTSLDAKVERVGEAAN